MPQCKQITAMVQDRECTEGLDNFVKIDSYTNCLFVQCCGSDVHKHYVVFSRLTLINL